MPKIEEVQGESAASSMSKPDSLPEPFMMSSQDLGGLPQPAIPSAEELDDDDEDLEETLSERLWGLTEMFPERLRNFTGGVVSVSWNGSKTCYSLGKSVLWVLASSAAILALPVMFETERAQMEEHQIQQQRQILLGPNAAVSGGGSGMGLSPGAMPQIVPPPSAQTK